MNPRSVFEALQLAISPVILISACGLLLLSMTNRLGRAIDRARLLVRDTTHPGNDLQVAILSRRARWIRSSILFTSIAILTTALMVLCIFLSVFLMVDVSSGVSILFVLSLFSLMIALLYFIVDIFASLKAMDAELNERTKNGSGHETSAFFKS